MSDKVEPKEEKKVELPPLDISKEEIKRAADLSDKAWREIYENRIPVEVVATQFCRERQLLAALATIQQKDEVIEYLMQRDAKHIEEYCKLLSELKQKYEQIAELENANINLKEGRK